MTNDYITYSLDKKMLEDIYASQKLKLIKAIEIFYLLIKLLKYLT